MGKKKIDPKAAADKTNEAAENLGAKTKEALGAAAVKSQEAVLGAIDQNGKHNARTMCIPGEEDHQNVVIRLCDTICALSPHTIRSITARSWIVSCFNWGLVLNKSLRAYINRSLSILSTLLKTQVCKEKVNRGSQKNPEKTVVKKLQTKNGQRRKGSWPGRSK